ncbi:MAG: alpha/beta fold hydrolase, partial [Terriglobales bacterium]
MKRLLAGLVVGSVWLLGPVAQAQGLGPEIKSGYFQTSDKVRLHYLETGSGPAIVFVPGWTCPTWVWEPQLR